MSEEQVVAQKLRRTAAEIEQIVSEYKRSGLNRSQFCRSRGLTLGVLNRYLKRLRAASNGGGNGDGLVAVELAGEKPGARPGSNCSLSVVLRSGREIGVRAGFDVATLQRLVQVLETM